MRTGWIASGVGHSALVLFLIFGVAFSRDPLPPLEVAEVTVISEEEFAMLMRPETAPEAGAGVTAPAPPQAPSEAPPPAARPEVAEETAEEAEPEAAASPELTAPPPADVPPQEQPSPDPAPRVAPEATPEPPVEAEEAPEIVEDVTPEPEAEADEVVEEETPAAPEEASTEIVTEAEEPGGVSDAPVRPRARPDRLARMDPGRSFEAASEPEPDAPAEPEPTPEADVAENPPEPEVVETPPDPEVAETPPDPEVAETEAEETQAEDDPLASAIAGAVADAISNTPEAAPDQGAAAGPPLSQGEREAFRVAVERCWIVDPGSPAASVTVIVGMRMTRDAKPDTASIEMLGAQGGDDGAVRTAYEAARRAILRCGADGFPLPAEKYERWAQVEMTFNPEGMRVR